MNKVAKAFTLGRILRFLRRFWWIILIVLCAIVFAFWRLGAGQAKVKGVNPYAIKRQTLEQELVFSGKIAADEHAVLHFQTGGQLSWLGVKEGDTVKAGSVIATLDQRGVRKTLEKYLNTYTKERLDFDNEKKVRENIALPMNPYDRQNLIDSFKKAQYDLNNSVLDVELQDVALQYSTLSSPINGIVTHLDTSVAGVNVTPTTSFEVVNPDTMHFAASADQTEIVQLSQGMTGQITFDAYPEETYSTSVISLGYTPQEDETGTVYEVKLSIDGSGLGRYRLGMTGDVGFITKQIPSAIAVPISYVKTEGSRKYVYRLTNKKYEKVYVVEGDLFDSLVQITKGLDEGDVVVEE